MAQQQLALQQSTQNATNSSQGMQAIQILNPNGQVQTLNIVTPQQTQATPATATDQVSKVLFIEFLNFFFSFS